MFPVISNFKHFPLWPIAFMLTFTLVLQTNACGVLESDLKIKQLRQNLVGATQCNKFLDDFKLPEDGPNFDKAWERVMAGNGEGLGPVRSDDPELGCKINLGPGIYTFTSTLVISRRMILSGQGPLNSELRFVNTSGIHVCFRGNCPAPNKSGYGAETLLQDFSIIYSGEKVSTREGILVEARTHARNIHVQNFPGSGIALDACARRSWADGGPSAANLTTWFNVRSTGNQGDGWRFEGCDSNENVLIGVDASSNEGWGYRDKSFLGNNPLAAHGGNNTSGCFQASRPGQRGRIVLYCESGGPNNREGTVDVAPPNLLINPRAEAKDMKSSPPMIQPDTSRLLLSNFETIQTGQETQMSFGGGDVDPLGVRSFVDKELDPSGVFRYKRLSGGHADTLAWSWKGSGAFVGYGMTSKFHARGPAMPYMPRGLLMGNSAVSRSMHMAAAPPAPDNSKFKTGDLIFKSDSTILEGWRYDSTDTGSWVAFPAAPVCE